MVCNRALKSCEVKSAPAIATASSSSSSSNKVAHPWRSQQQGSEEKEKTDEKVFALDPVMQLV